jgi:hypothetical protein
MASMPLDGHDDKADEGSHLLPSSSSSSIERRHIRRHARVMRILVSLVAMAATGCLWMGLTSKGRMPDDDVYDDSPIEITFAEHGPSHSSSSSTIQNVPLEGSTNRRYWKSPEAQKRCQHVIKVFEERATAFKVPHHVLKEEYKVQSVDYNVFFRATAELFWLDFAGGKWANFSLGDIGIYPTLNGVPFNDKSLYTWITGDQHLSNFGAWRNRGGDVVFSVNDFDEAAIYGKSLIVADGERELRIVTFRLFVNLRNTY